MKRLPQFQATTLKASENRWNYNFAFYMHFFYLQCVCNHMISILALTGHVLVMPHSCILYEIVVYSVACIVVGGPVP